MNKWTNEQKNQWTNEEMKKRINEQINKWTNEQMNKWTNEQMNKWTNEKMNKCTHERRQLRSNPLNIVESKYNSLRKSMIGDGKMNEQTQTVTIDYTKQTPLEE